MTTTITVIGNSVGPPESGYTRSGKRYLELVVLESRRTSNGAGEWTDAEPNRYVVKAFEELAENTAATLTSGSARVSVTGQIRTETWIDQSTGKKRSRQIIVAKDIATSLRFAVVDIHKPSPSTPQGQAWHPEVDHPERVAEAG